MQMAVIDVARNLLEYKPASSSEFGKIDTPVIGLLTEWIKDEEIQKETQSEYGGTMRLGSYPAILKKDSKVRNIYGSKKLMKDIGIDMRLTCRLLTTLKG